MSPKAQTPYSGSNRTKVFVDTGIKKVCLPITLRKKSPTPKGMLKHFNKRKSEAFALKPDESFFKKTGCS